jgi:hypothetical protein
MEESINLIYISSELLLMIFKNVIGNVPEIKLVCKKFNNIINENWRYILYDYNFKRLSLLDLSDKEKFMILVNSFDKKFFPVKNLKWIRKMVEFGYPMDLFKNNNEFSYPTILFKNNNEFNYLVSLFENNNKLDNPLSLFKNNNEFSYDIQVEPKLYIRLSKLNHFILVFVLHKYHTYKKNGSITFARTFLSKSDGFEKLNWHEVKFVIEYYGEKAHDIIWYVKKHWQLIDFIK